jgi:hypothetical protein
LRAFPGARATSALSTGSAEADGPPSALSQNGTQQLNARVRTEYVPTINGFRPPNQLQSLDGHSGRTETA